jgi:hypothetical protein
VPALALALCLGGAGPALAQTGGFWDRVEERGFDRLRLQIQHPPRRTDGFPGSWFTTGALAATWAGLQRGADPPSNPRWSSQILFDADARNGLRARSTLVVPTARRDGAGLTLVRRF